MVWLLPSVRLHTLPNPHHGRVGDHLAMPFVHRTVSDRDLGSPEVTELQNVQQMLGFFAGRHRLQQLLDLIANACCHSGLRESARAVEEAIKDPRLLLFFSHRKLQRLPMGKARFYAKRKHLDESRP